MSMPKIVTVTVDLEKVAYLCERIAQGNSGLETEACLRPDDLDAMMDILVTGPCMEDFRSLLRTIIKLHKASHNLHKNDAPTFY